jgi:hypothetical protein
MSASMDDARRTGHPRDIRSLSGASLVLAVSAAVRRLRTGRDRKVAPAKPPTLS